MGIIAPDAAGMGDIEEIVEAKVGEVFDGDGFLADIWHPVRAEWLKRVPFRFAFIDAPEMQQPFGPESRKFLHDLIADRVLSLGLIGKESMGFMPIDKFRRMLCVGFLTDEIGTGEIHYFSNGKCDVGVVRRVRSVSRNVELEMIINGWAWVTEQYVFEREEEYFAAQEDARRHRRGLWSMEDPEPPWRFKQRLKRQGQGAERQPGLFAIRCEAEGCDGVMVERAGALGTFLGCSNFPRCRFSRRI